MALLARVRAPRVVAPAGAAGAIPVTVPAALNAAPLLPSMQSIFEASGTARMNAPPDDRTYVVFDPVSGTMQVGYPVTYTPPFDPQPVGNETPWMIDSVSGRRVVPDPDIGGYLWADEQGGGRAPTPVQLVVSGAVYQIIQKNRASYPGLAVDSIGLPHPLEGAPAESLFSGGLSGLFERVAPSVAAGFILAPLAADIGAFVKGLVPGAPAGTVAGAGAGFVDSSYALGAADLASGASLVAESSGAAAGATAGASGVLDAAVTVAQSVGGELLKAGAGVGKAVLATAAGRLVNALLPPATPAGMQGFDAGAAVQSDRADAEFIQRAALLGVGLLAVLVIARKVKS